MRSNIYQEDVTPLRPLPIPETLIVEIKTYLRYPSELRTKRVQQWSPGRSHEGPEFVDRNELSIRR